MNFGIEGKVALVTGGSHGIGLAIVKVLIEEGCQVAVCSRNPGPPENGNIISIKADAATISGQYLSVNSAIAAWHSPDILINNVGGGGRWGTTFEETPDEVWSQVYEKNAMAAVRFTRLVLSYMRKQKWGRVVTVASIYGREGGGKPWFNMAKSAEISLMKCLAMEKIEGVTFNTVSPGPIQVDETDFFEDWRIGKPEDVAAVVAFLCSQQAKHVNGANIAIDGGEGRAF